MEKVALASLHLKTNYFHAKWTDAINWQVAESLQNYSPFGEMFLHNIFAFSLSSSVCTPIYLWTYCANGIFVTSTYWTDVCFFSKENQLILQTFFFCDIQGLEMRLALLIGLSAPCSIPKTTPCNHFPVWHCAPVGAVTRYGTWYCSIECNLMYCNTASILLLCQITFQVFCTYSVQYFH